MKRICYVLLIILNFYLFLHSVSLKEVWSVQNLDVPESAIYYPSEDVIFVSNINGEPTDKDRNGYISKIKPNGEVVDKKWIATLDAPKGMAIVGNYLYVADIDQLVIIDIKKSLIISRIKVNNAEFLNDVAADANGNVYISDSSSNPGVIYRFSNGKVKSWVVSSKIKRPNGLLVKDDFLYVGSFANGDLNKIDIKTKNVEFIGNFINAIDGVTEIDSTYFALSNWFNKIVIVKNFGEKYDFKVNHNCADIFYMKDKGLLLVPAFFNNKIVAYKIEKE